MLMHTESHYLPLKKVSLNSFLCVSKHIYGYVFYKDTFEAI